MNRFLSLWHSFRFILRHPLNRKAPLKALGRFLYWQLTAPGRGKRVIRSFAGNTSFYAARGWTGVTGNIYCGLHEFAEMGFALHLLQPGDLFIDAGAHMGTYTLLASGVRAARSIAVEPVGAAFEQLQENIRLNRLELLVRSVPAALGAAPGQLSFETGKGTMSRVSPGRAGEQEVPVTTLDALDPGDPGLILLKLDVEGYESAVLDGAAVLLQDPRLQAIIIELNGSGKAYGFRDEDTHQRLLAAGFRPYTYHPFERRLEALGSFGPYNTIYLRDAEGLQQRLLHAADFSVLDRQL